MPAYEVTIGERTLRVRLRREGSTQYAAVDDSAELPVQLDRLRGSLHSLMHGELRTELLAARTDDGVELNIGGIAYRAEVMDEARARLAQVMGRGGAAHGRRELKAPMPGLVVKVLAEDGQDVEPHAPLVVLQAMKMENELALPRGGRVSSVKVQVGQTVEAGQVLITLEE